MTDTSFLSIGAYAAFGFSALGSALGCGQAAASAIGSWKRCYSQGKAAPFQLTILTGVPMSQTIYGLILMLMILNCSPSLGQTAVATGILGGLGIGASAAYQGRAAAGACDAFSDTHKGFVNYLLALGIVETIAIFIMVFSIMFLGRVANL